MTGPSMWQVLCRHQRAACSELLSVKVGAEHLAQHVTPVAKSSFPIIFIRTSYLTLIKMAVKA